MKSVDYVILGHKNPDVDSIVSGVLLEKYLSRHGYDCKFIIPDLSFDDDTFFICDKYGINISNYQDKLPNNINQKYILVDHFERDVLGSIVGVIDHHPTSKNFQYPYYRNEKASSTASMIVKGKEDEFSRNEIYLAVLATMVDTVSFHSSKTLLEDISWMERMVKDYQFVYNQLYHDGLCLTKITDVVDFLSHGLKMYQFDDKKIASSYVMLLHPEKYNKMYPEVFSLIQDFVFNQDLELFALLVHDMSEFKSSVYYINSQAVQKENFNHFVSRGSEIIPKLEQKIYKKNKQC